jgi:hypothetical protein
MYPIAILRHRKQLENDLKHRDSHRAYLAGLKQEGLFMSVACIRVPGLDWPELLDVIRTLRRALLHHSPKRLPAKPGRFSI